MGATGQRRTLSLHVCVVTELIICIILYYVTIYIWHPAYISVCYVVISEFGLSVTGARNCSASCECTPRQQTTVMYVCVLVERIMLGFNHHFCKQVEKLCSLCIFYFSKHPLLVNTM